MNHDKYKMNPEITYLVANYNNGKYINDCIASLHAQTNPNWYCLIADDKSTDNSVDIIRPLLNDKIKLIQNKQNVGYTATLIKLIDHAPTDTVGILDPDDALYPDATEAILQAYKKHPHVGFVYSNCTFFQNNLKRVKSAGNSRAISPCHTSLTTGLVNHLKTFKISRYRLTEGYDPNILYAEDRDIVYKMEEVTQFHFIDRPLYKFRFVPHSQFNNPAKRRLGKHNHLKAYRNALRRRGIVGCTKKFYMLLGYLRCYVVDRRWPVSTLAFLLLYLVTPFVKILDYRA